MGFWQNWWLSGWSKLSPMAITYSIEQTNYKWNELYEAILTGQMTQYIFVTSSIKLFLWVEMLLKHTNCWYEIYVLSPLGQVLAMVIFNAAYRCHNWNYTSHSHQIVATSCLALKFGLLLSLLKLIMTFIYFYITALQCGLVMVLYYASLERKQVLMLYP